MPVLDAVYGYWSMVTSTPRARAASTSFSDLHALAPVGLADDLVVRDLRGQSALFADADGLSDAIENMRGLFAHVRDVDPAHAAHHFREFDHFFGGREVSRHIEEAGGKAEGAIEHGLRRQRLHLLDLFRRGLAIGQAHHLLRMRALPHASWRN